LLVSDATARRHSPATVRRRRRAPLLGRLRLGYVSPAVLLVAVLLYLPFLWTVYQSFTNYTGLGPTTWAGIANYRALLHDPVLDTAIRNTLLWVAGTLVLPVALGLLVAVLSFNIKGGGWYRLPFLLPYAMSGTGVAVAWSVILEHGGIANSLLSSLRLPGGGESFLLYAPQNTIAMIIATTWQQLGVNALLFVVGLQSIPREPIEAARIDGASGWTLFRRIYWPLLAPLTTVVVGLALVASLKTFDLVWVMTQGGPGTSSQTLAIAMYRDTFVADEYGYGSAIAVVLTVVTGLVSFLYLRRQLGTRRALGA
jgi:ABC-type sugar transport system permease subunit